MISFSAPELDKLIQHNIDSLGGKRGLGLLPAMRAAAKYLRQKHALGFQRHVSPDGVPWPKSIFKEAIYRQPALGKVSPIDNRNGDIVFAQMKTHRQVARSATVVAELNAGRKDVKVDALYRPRGAFSTQTSSLLKYSGRKGHEQIRMIRAAGMLYGMMTKDRVAGSATKIRRDGLIYGLTAGAAAWAGIHQRGGGTFRGKPVPVRQFIGMTNFDIQHIMKLINDTTGRMLASRRTIFRAPGSAVA